MRDFWNRTCSCYEPHRSLTGFLLPDRAIALLRMAVVTPLLCSSCSILGLSLWRSRARLYPTHVELSGWSWTGRTVRRIPLDSIQQVRWWGGKCDVNLELTLEDGRIVALYLQESAGTWNYTLRRLRTNAEQPNPEPASPHDSSTSAPSPSERTAPHRVGVATS